MKIEILGSPLPNIPFEERPANCSDVMWRYSKNPIISRHQVRGGNSIFNSAVVPFKDGFAGVFRIDDQGLAMTLHAGFSSDGITWDIREEAIQFKNLYGDCGKYTGGYDPRVVFIEDRYYIVWCNCHNGSTVALGYTFDFQEFFQLPNAFPPFNRNGVLFPEKINGHYALLNRPSDNWHTPYGNIFYAESPDLKFWGMHREVMKTVQGSWQECKIGAGPIPIKTSEGWLLFYHGVVERCNGFVYSFGAALLDLNEPWKVIARGRQYLLSPQMPYECVGDVQNVTFPCAALCDAQTGRIAVYYGCADTVTGLAFCRADEVIDFIRRDSVPYCK
ncbi:MAG: glycoside hydrolase family 130 protein [Victivallales bacterium]|jgi:beta-1,4-mannooligosaccharide/beta-1,4-mannosyl-N-acetylglucosamine phosphorylase|nr:glycoside hydrolase family 130 protein [Victivallales bacterium]